jgi:hypothetical protein
MLCGRGAQIWDGAKSHEWLAHPYMISHLNRNWFFSFLKLEICIYHAEKVESVCGSSEFSQQKFIFICGRSSYDNSDQPAFGAMLDFVDCAFS